MFSCYTATKVWHQSILLWIVWHLQLEIESAQGLKQIIRVYTIQRNIKVYATFKERKFESLFYKINTCLQKNTTCTGFRAEQIFSVNIYNIYFFNFVGDFCDSSPLLSPEAPAFCDKKVLK